MEILEFGDKRKQKIILIHGFQSPYQVWEPYIRHYEEDFHVIVPIMPGHNPNPAHREDFISFQAAARELEDYFISRYGTAVYAVFGMSMGGVLAATLWQNGRLHIEKIIFDGTPLVSFGGLMQKMMERFYLTITKKSQQRDPKTLDQAVKSIITEEHLPALLQVLDNMSDATITNCISGIAAYRLPPDLDAGHTRIYFFHGTAPNEMLAARSAKYILRSYPGSVIRRFPGKAHCENALFHPEVMLEELDTALR